MDDVQKAIAAVKANPSDACSPLPWSASQDAPDSVKGCVDDANGCDVVGAALALDAAHIAAAVNAVPLLIAEVERLQAQLAAARVAVGNLPPYPHTQLRCSPSGGVPLHLRCQQRRPHRSPPRAGVGAHARPARAASGAGGVAMTDLDLARRAVACRGWRWMDGALTVSGWRVCSIGANKAGAQVLNQADGEYWVTAQDELPDLADPATRGCLLELTKEAREAHFGYVTCQRYRHADRDYAPDMWETDWVYWDTPEGPTFKSGSYEAALIAALEAAPERKK